MNFPSLKKKSPRGIFSQLPAFSVQKCFHWLAVCDCVFCGRLMGVEYFSFSDIQSNLSFQDLLSKVWHMQSICCWNMKILRKSFIINICVWFFWGDIYSFLLSVSDFCIALVQTHSSPAAFIIRSFWYHYLCVCLMWQWFIVFFMLCVHYLPNMLCFQGDMGLSGPPGILGPPVSPPFFKINLRHASLWSVIYVI